MSKNEYTCATENIAAYVDGELEATLQSSFENHLPRCSRCTAELEAQRTFMCELDSVLAARFELAVPQDFAQVVAVHAESDMRGVRDRAEHARALKLCLILGAVAFALMGATSSKAFLVNVQLLAEKVFSVFGLLSRTIYDAAAGMTVLFRVFSRGLTDSPLAGLAVLLLAALIIGLLTLISRYHGTRATD